MLADENEQLLAAGFTGSSAAFLKTYQFLSTFTMNEIVKHYETSAEQLSLILAQCSSAFALPLI